MVNIKNLDPSQTKMVEKSYKNIHIYHIGYVMVNNFSYAATNSVKFLNIIIDKINGCIKESNGNKYLTLVPIDKNKDTLLKSMKN